MCSVYVHYKYMYTYSFDNESCSFRINSSENSTREARRERERDGETERKRLRWDPLLVIHLFHPKIFNLSGEKIKRFSGAEGITRTQHKDLPCRFVFGLGPFPLGLWSYSGLELKWKRTEWTMERFRWKEWFPQEKDNPFFSTDGTFQPKAPNYVVLPFDVRLTVSRDVNVNVNVTSHVITEDNFWGFSLEVIRFSNKPVRFLCIVFLITRSYHFLLCFPVSGREDNSPDRKHISFSQLLGVFVAFNVNFPIFR